MLPGRIESHGSSMATLHPWRSTRPGSPGRPSLAPHRRWSPARPRSIAAAVAPVAAGLLAACVAEPPEVAVDDPELSAGRAVYAENCATCHGTAGGGAAGTPLNEGSVVATFPEIEDQVAVVADGGEQMPPFAGVLTDEQIRAVVRYTREVL